MKQTNVAAEIALFNDLYHTCLEIDKLALFYGLLQCLGKDTHKTQKREVKPQVKTRKIQPVAITLKFLFPFMFFCKFINASGTMEYIWPASQATPHPRKRDMKGLETTALPPVVAIIDNVERLIESWITGNIMLIH